MTMPERPDVPREILQRGTRDLVAENNLLKIVENNHPELHADWRDFEEYNEALSRIAGVMIPNDLSSQLGLTSLKWRAFGFKHPTILIMGRTGKIASETNSRIEPMKDDISKAEAIIEIAGVEKMIGNPPSRKWHDKFSPFYLRIAGIDKKQKKIIAATYDLNENNRITKAEASIPDEEFGRGPDFDPMARLFLESKLPLSYFESFPYKSAGLITPEMRKVTKHEFYLASEFTASGFAYMKNIDPFTLATISALGYYAQQKEGVVEIGLIDEAAKRRGVAPWKINLPETLPKTL